MSGPILGGRAGSLAPQLRLARLPQVDHICHRADLQGRADFLKSARRAKMMADWVVRLAREADAEGVGRVLHSAYAGFDLPGQDRACLAEALAAITAPPLPLLRSGRYFVAERESALLGCGGWSPQPPPSLAGRDGVGHLRHFATHADWAGRGVGHSLHAASEAQALGEGMKRLDVVSTPGAETFYRGLGFEALGPIDVPIAGFAMPAVYMTKRLRPDPGAPALEAGRTE
jgi:GNAT superfamily N-acetyltransferase